MGSAGERTYGEGGGMRCWDVMMDDGEGWREREGLNKEGVEEEEEKGAGM